MINFTFENHLKSYIGNRLYGERKTPYESFTVQVGPVDNDYYKKSNWLKEQYRIADLVYTELGKDFVVMFSGGTDSEIVLRAFRHIGITPRPIFIRFVGDHNLGELHAALEVTADLGLELEVIDLDIIEYYRCGRATELAKSIQCSNMAFLAVYQTIIDLQMPAIMGASVTIHKEPGLPRSKWFYNYNEQEDMAVLRVSNKYGIPIIHEWFSYTPEAIGYFMEHPVIQEVITNDNLYKNYTDSSKNLALQSWMPSIIPKKKKTGYESLIGLRQESAMTFKKNLIPRLEHCLDGIYVDELRTQLFGGQHACY